MAELIRRFRTFNQFEDRNPAFPISTLRWIRFRSKGQKPNGFAPAFVKVGGRVLIDEEKFFAVIARQNGPGEEAA